MGDRGAEAGSVNVTGLVKRYGAETVVSNVDLSIAPGEFFSLLGPSGSGKTTTLMAIAGFVEPEAGSVRLGGKEVQSTPPQQRGLGMVFQNYALFPHLDVFENVAFPLRIRRQGEEDIRKRVREALAIVRLEAFERRSTRQLSGGQQQRVALARAIVFRPPIVLMDEPLGALDKNLRYEMQVEIKDIQKRLGMTVVYVTHDQEEAMNMSDRIAIMNRGRIVQLGAPRDVYEHPETAFAGRFLGEANLFAGQAHGLRFATAGGADLHAGYSGEPAGAAYLFVRPEKIRINAGPPGADENALSGTVTRVSFLGGVIRYAVDVGEPQLLTVDTANTDAAAILEEGAPVALAWRIGDTRILGDGEQPR